jgi:hypothetical protein
MDEPTLNELLADAVACATLDVLASLADAPEARARFFRELLELMARFGSPQAAMELRAMTH